MNQEIGDILSGKGESLPDAGATAVETSLEPTNESSTEQGQTIEATDEQQATEDTQAEREKRRGSGAQLDARDERHREEVERIKKEEGEKYRRMLAAEVTRKEREWQEQRAREQQQQNPQDAFDQVIADPKGFVRSEWQQYEQQRQFEANQREFLKDLTYVRHMIGTEPVNEAVAAFDAAYEAGQIPVGELQAIAESPSKTLAAVEWHKNRKRTEIVQKPEVQNLLERISATPDLIGKIELLLSNPQGTQQQPVNPDRPVMPSNIAGAPNVGTRDGPAWPGPKTIFDILNHARPTG